jgi:hypothetical protein
MVQVDAHGAFAEHQPGGDLCVREPAGGKCEDVKLPG